MNITIAVTATLASRMRNMRVQLRWFGWVVRLVGVVFLVWWWTDRTDLAMLALGLLYLAGPELLGAARQLMSRRYGRDYTYTLTDSGVGIRTAITNLEFAWTAVTAIRPVRAGWVIKFPGGGSFVLPKDVMTPGQVAEWQAFVAARRVTPV